MKPTDWILEQKRWADKMMREAEKASDVSYYAGYYVALIQVESAATHADCQREAQAISAVQDWAKERALALAA